MQWLHGQVDQLQGEKLEIESHAAEQADTCAQLTEANKTLSARALSMAEEAAAATDTVRKQLEDQLAESNASLSSAREDIEDMRMSQQTQQMALLEELNSVQTENTNLRAQLLEVSSPPEKLYRNAEPLAVWDTKISCLSGPLENLENAPIRLNRLPNGYALSRPRIS